MKEEYGLKLFLLFLLFLTDLWNRLNDFDFMVAITFTYSCAVVVSKLSILDFTLYNLHR